MNWGRGLYRVWVIVAIVWAIGFGAFAVTQIAKRYKPVDPQSPTIFFYPQYFDEVESGEPSHRCMPGDEARREAMVEGVPGAGPMTLLVVCEPESDTSWSDQYLQPDQLEAGVKMVVERIKEFNAEEHLKLLQGIAGTLVGMALPVALLLVVLVLRWIVRGFRQPA